VQHPLNRMVPRDAAGEHGDMSWGIPGQDEEIEEIGTEEIGKDGTFSFILCVMTPEDY